MKYIPKLFLAIIAAVLAVVTAAAQDSMSTVRLNPSAHPGHNQINATGNLMGFVRSTDNKPVKDARVEISDQRTGHVASAAYTNENGEFEIDNLPLGAYEVSVTHGLAQDRQQVTLDAAGATVAFHLAERTTADTQVGNNSSVSVAEMKVPKKARQHLEKAQEALKKQKVDEAVKEIDAAVEAYPEYAKALTLRGIIRMDQGHTQDAMNDFQGAITADPNYALAYTAIGSAYNSLGQFDNAARSLDRAQEIDPRGWQAHFEMSKAEIGREHYDVALREINRALELSPQEFPPMHLVRAHIYLSQKNYPEAMADLEQYLAKAPQDANAEAARKTLDQVRAFTAQK